MVRDQRPRVVDLWSASYETPRRTLSARPVTRPPESAVICVSFQPDTPVAVCLILSPVAAVPRKLCGKPADVARYRHIIPPPSTPCFLALMADGVRRTSRPSTLIYRCYVRMALHRHPTRPGTKTLGKTPHKGEFQAATEAGGVGVAVGGSQSGGNANVVKAATARSRAKPEPRPGSYVNDEAAIKAAVRDANAAMGQPITKNPEYAEPPRVDAKIVDYSKVVDPAPVGAIYEAAAVRPIGPAAPMYRVPAHLSSAAFEAEQTAEWKGLKSGGRSIPITVS